ncbi:hypothetical protein CFIO01_11378 [Colletotrichum fioriniae PJ7]|uniref:Uncharacterized protein n=1 Tax=Colletotrichum fioriniae PJ7 TaxID=1445577 RepID=A0A010RUF0_9PEZI|nr:hypothetical protein CFIO01_11378 [Colletotrichum fioriniae PJ7]
MSAALLAQTQTNVTISPQKPAIEPSPRGEAHTTHRVHSLDRFHIETCAAGTLAKDPLSRATSAVVVVAVAATALLPIVVFFDSSRSTLYYSSPPYPSRNISSFIPSTRLSSSSAPSPSYHHVQPFPPPNVYDPKQPEPLRPSISNQVQLRVAVRGVKPSVAAPFRPPCSPSASPSLPGTYCHGLLALEPSHYSRCAVPSTTSTPSIVTPQPQPRGIALLAWSAAPPAVLGA